jgi:hypothetical protein
VTTEPVDSTAAALVTLTRYSASFGLAQGFVRIDPALVADVVGLPQITAQSTDPLLANAEITAIQPATGGFAFHVRFPALDPADASGAAPNLKARVTFQVVFEIACGPGVAVDAASDARADSGTEGGTDTRLVSAVTYVESCAGDWTSSGAGCQVCPVVAEMAPSPIVPDKTKDDLPLARVLRLRVVPVARVGRTLVLFAENDGGEGLDYSWHPSGGAVVRVAEDVVVWTPPDRDGPHAIQVAVEGPDGAAVATFACQEAA